MASDSVAAVVAWPAPNARQQVARNTMSNKKLKAADIGRTKTGKNVGRRRNHVTSIASFDYFSPEPRAAEGSATSVSCVTGVENIGHVLSPLVVKHCRSCLKTGCQAALSTNPIVINTCALFAGREYEQRQGKFITTNRILASFSTLANSGSVVSKPPYWVVDSFPVSMFCRHTCVTMINFPNDAHCGHVQ